MLALFLSLSVFTALDCTSSVCGSPKLVLLQCGRDGQVVENIEVTELSHMLDYSQPHAPGTPAFY